MDLNGRFVREAFKNSNVQKARIALLEGTKQETETLSSLAEIFE